MEENQIKKLTIIDSDKNFYAISYEVADRVGKSHKHLMRDIRTYIDALEDRTSNLIVEDFFVEATYFDGNNRQQPCYWLTKKGCDMIANKMTGKKGILFTGEYVTAFEDMYKTIQSRLSPVLDSYTIEDPIERAKRWIEEQTEKQLLAVVAEEQQKEILTLAPKAAFADAVAASNDCILIRELAKILKQNGAKTGEQRLKEKLRDYGFLIKNPIASDYNLPTQRSMELGLFRIKETTISSSSGSVHVTKTPKVTTKGVQYFVDKYLQGKMVL